MKRVDGLTFSEYIKKRLLILDGATGTFLLQNGLKPGQCPELFAAQNADLLVDIQRRYLEAGSRALYTCTFGANAIKLKDYGLERETESLNARLASLTANLAGERAFVGGNMGTTGVFLHPLGELDFEQAVSVFKQQAKVLASNGADFIVIETMIDLQEARAAVIAAKEACSIPVAVCMTFDKHGRTLTGTGAAAAAIALICCGADVVGLNCSTGPQGMPELLKEMKAVSSVPIIVKPNAGMPHIKDGKQYFDLSSREFRKFVKPLYEAGANLIGGCCGTDPDYISAIAEETAGLEPKPWRSELPPAITSQTEKLCIGRQFRIIGERINPTGKPKLKQAIIDEDYDAVLELGAKQGECGAHILDVNVGVPGVDEKNALKRAIEVLSVQLKLPLCIDTSNVDAASAALRIYPGRALLNSLSAKSAHMRRLLPVIKKYKPMFILLPIDDNGISDSAQQRIDIIQDAYAVLNDNGIDKQSVLVDALVMAVSSDSQAALETLKVIKWCSDNGFNTVFGLSNVSFGLPRREQLNMAYLMMAMTSGLSAAIMDAADTNLVDLCFAAEALTGNDKEFGRYLNRFSDLAIAAQTAGTLFDSILYGKKAKTTAFIDGRAKNGEPPQAIIDTIIAALDKVGEFYEQRKFFLPQLIYSAEAARTAFDHIEKIMPAAASVKRGKKVVIATVKGDIHDIGKNLVAMLLKNHGFEVIDLGKDVPAKTIINAAREHNADIIGLSALITTTAHEMKEVIELKKKHGIAAKVLVGGAVITEEYAESIGADGYAADAAGAVKKAQQLLR